jgi:hypothetical protein
VRPPAGDGDRQRKRYEGTGRAAGRTGLYRDLYQAARDQDQDQDQDQERAGQRGGGRAEQGVTDPAGAGSVSSPRFDALQLAGAGAGAEG